MVVVNTNEFIDSRAKLERTEKVPVFHGYPTNFELKPFEKLKKRAIFIKPGIIGTKNLKEILNKKITSCFFFMTRTLLYITLYHLDLDHCKLDYHAFKKETNYYESFKVFYFRKNLKSSKKQILYKR